MKDNKTCIECGVELQCPNNWWASFVGKKHYKCTSCYSVRRTENTIKRKYKEGKEPSPKLLAKLLGRKHKAEYNKIENGYVYIISNPAWKGWYKIGMAVDAKDRCKAYQTSSPLRDFKLEYSRFFDNRRSSEKLVHDKLTDTGCDNRGEWFKLSLNKIKTIIKDMPNES